MSFRRLMNSLARWRHDDQADHCTLTRHEVITLLDGVEKMNERDVEQKLEQWHRDGVNKAMPGDVGIGLQQGVMAGQRKSAPELLRSFSAQLERRAQGMRELADILQASQLVRGGPVNDQVWELIQSLSRMPV